MGGNRRNFLKLTVGAALTVMTAHGRAKSVSDQFMPVTEQVNTNAITLFLCGDVMTGRGIDQVLPHAGDPRLFESYVKSAIDYVELAEEMNGPIRKPVDFAYIWGDALKEFDRLMPDVRIINLETAVTTSDEYWAGKGINYRMHPENIGCLTAANIDCCVLANNHVLDWGHAGLEETLHSLRAAGIATAGAGRNSHEAQAPAIIEKAGKGRVIILALGSVTSGVPLEWAATPDRAGVNLLTDLSSHGVDSVAQQLREIRRPGDIAVVSIHWGGNWGYGVSRQQSDFAHRLIDTAGADIIYGHSSHHPKGIEVHQGKPIVYGCGDFIDDYEGIGGYEEFRGDLTLMYFVSMDPGTGELLRFDMTPMQIKRFRLNYPNDADVRWLHRVLQREGKKYGTQVELHSDNTLALRWQ